MMQIVLRGDSSTTVRGSVAGVPIAYVVPEGRAALLSSFKAYLNGLRVFDLVLTTAMRHGVPVVTSATVPGEHVKSDGALLMVEYADMQEGQS